MPAEFKASDLGQLPEPGRLDVSYSGIIYNQLSSSKGSSGTPDPSTKPFTIQAYNSVHPKTIHMMDIVASDGRFWVGNKTTSSCPPGVNACPVGNVTALKLTDEGRADLVSDIFEKRMSQLLIGVQFVALPGGQSLYVNRLAELRFTETSDLPFSSKKLRFSRSPPPGPSALIYSGVGKATGYLACPIAPLGPWQVFVGVPGIKDGFVPGGDLSQCIGFDAFATDYTSQTPAAYQYVRR
ncbi:MAG: hypothetical protein LQ344_004128 [Seirophora lacunosa]|nr:MAG: hypothetical protein LQ344_004128 [Seirophora lacunosa]